MVPHVHIAHEKDNKRNQSVAALTIHHPVSSPDEIDGRIVCSAVRVNTIISPKSRMVYYIKGPTSSS